MCAFYAAIFSWSLEGNTFHLHLMDFCVDLRTLRYQLKAFQIVVLSTNKMLFCPFLFSILVSLANLTCNTHPEMLMKNLTTLWVMILIEFDAINLSISIFRYHCNSLFSSCNSLVVAICYCNSFSHMNMHLNCLHHSCSFINVNVISFIQPPSPSGWVFIF